MLAKAGVNDSVISPPAWGWPGTSYASLLLKPDFPTRVGMARPA